MSNDISGLDFIVHVQFLTHDLSFGGKTTNQPRYIVLIRPAKQSISLACGRLEFISRFFQVLDVLPYRSSAHLQFPTQLLTGNILIRMCRKHLQDAFIYHKNSLS
ncbi:hypothetical protein D3C73_1141580 [compost metagenome]